MLLFLPAIHFVYTNSNPFPKTFWEGGGAVKKSSFFTAPAKSRTGNRDFAAIFFVFALLFNEFDRIYGGKTAAKPCRREKGDGC